MKKQFLLFLFLIPVFACQDEKQESFPLKDAVEQDREALIALYQTLDGDKWRDNTNWCSNKPVSEWYGVDEVDEKGRVAQLDLTLNKVSGVLPPEIGQLTALKTLKLNYNNLQGEIPETLGKLINLESLYLSSNKLTGPIPQCIGTLAKLNVLYLQSNRLTGTIPENITDLKNLSTLYLNDNRLTGSIPANWKKPHRLAFLALSGNELQGPIPEWMGEIAMNNNIFNRLAPQNKGHQLYVEMNSGSGVVHTDGEYEQYMTATKGTGYSIVVIGDGFIREDNAVGGWAETLMKKEVDYMFSLEPFRSLSDYFNVYLVYARSNERGVGSEEYEVDTKFRLYACDGSNMNMNLPGSRGSVTNDYLQEIGLHLKTPFSAVFLSNSFVSAGAVEQYDNFNVACTCPLYATFAHEVGGHGVGLLSDEYILYNTTIPAIQSMYISNAHKQGLYLNVDVTNDPKKIVWSKLLADSRYAGQAGIYEGGSWYAKGVWRSTEEGIMYANTSINDRFSAVNRWIIYKRIMLATVPGWKYDHEEFVKFDAPGRAEWQASQEDK